MVCDRCPATAVVETLLDTGLTLTWCLHHWRAYEEALTAYTIRTRDLRATVDQ